MLALSLGLIAALIWAMHDLLARKLSQGTALLPLILVVMASGSIALIAPVLAFGDWTDVPNKSIGVAVLAGFAFALASGALFRAFSLATTRVVAPIIGAYPVLSLFSAVLQGRSVTLWEWVAVLAVIAGIAVVSMTGQKGDGSKPVLPAMAWAALSACGFAATFAIGQEAARQGSELPVILITRLTTLSIIAVLFIAYRSSFASLRGNWLALCAMGLFDAAALSLVTVSGNLPFAEYAAIASSLFGVVTIILASYFLDEKLRPLQWIGVAVVFSGIGFLSAQS